jgi:hypothetical protein
MIDRKEKYSRALEDLEQCPYSSSNQLKAAICLVQLNDYTNARESFGAALRGLLEDRFWHGTSQPNMLIDTYILANQRGFLPQATKEIAAYSSDPRGKSLVALYAYAMTSLLLAKDEDAGVHVEGLLKKPKIKDTFAMGKAIKAIVERDQTAFDAALDNLLRVHDGKVKFGELRETPYGFLCLPAMSLALMALRRSMKVNSESEYISKGYLDYLLQHQDALP